VNNFGLKSKYDLEFDKAIIIYFLKIKAQRYKKNEDASKVGRFRVKRGMTDF